MLKYLPARNFTPKKNHLIIALIDYDRTFVISEGNVVINTVDFYKYNFPRLWTYICKLIYWAIRNCLNNGLEYCNPSKLAPRNPLKLLYLFALNSDNKFAEDTCRYERDFKE